MRLSLSALIALTIATPAAAAQKDIPYNGALDHPPTSTIMAEPVALMIAAFDSNGDARVTRAECEAGVARSFASIDTAKAGSLGYIQFADWAERWLGDRNALPSPYETDTDDNNRITLAELQAKIGEAFTRFDVNSDGVLDRSELLTLRGGLGNFDRNGKRKRR